MALKYLVGPVSARRAAEAWAGPRAAGDCLAFNAAGDLDLAIGPDDVWRDVLGRLPADWQPDLVVLEPAGGCVPPGLLRASVPLVALAADWDLRWHGYRQLLPYCERVLTDPPGAEVMRRMGWTHARAVNLCGPGRELLEAPVDAGDRDVDVLYLGDLSPAVSRERLPWLGRLAALAGRYNVAIRAADDDRFALLRRAKVVFNYNGRGACDRRAFEAAAAGALLFQEAGNREVSELFAPGAEYVPYAADDLEDRLAYYLDRPDERQALAAAARARVRDYDAETQWQRALADVEADMPALRAAAANRPAADATQLLVVRSWQALAAGADADPTLPRDLAAELEATPTAALHNAAGIVAAAGGDARAAGRHFRAALDADGEAPVAMLNVVEALQEVGQPDLAAEGARRLLLLLGRSEALPPAALDAALYPPGLDAFRVEWERAAWSAAGSPAAEARAKADLLRWRVQSLLAGWTGDLSHFHEAAVARADLPGTRAALGCALARLSRPAEALPHLRAAVEANPFDRSAARALAQALADAGDPTAAHRLARGRRQLHRAAPQAVPAENWFSEAPPVGDELASIIVLCHNEVAYTRLCLGSVLCHTRAPYELVLVDNGSSDGTADYLADLGRRPGPDRVTVIRNDDNKGFAAGCNQGIAAARGDYLVFLNNDTVVTAGWLDGLVRRSLSEWPRVGLVGAVTNESRPPQRVAPDYADLAGLAAFAARRRREFAGQSVASERLTGFCLLARREVLDRIGGFDERFGIGLFEDDDLSVRAARAGYRLLVAQDVYVHHYGSRTFTALAIDGPTALRENFVKFRAKWGDENSAGYQVPDSWRAAEAGAAPTAVVPAAGRPGRAKVSLCMIVKNEEANLPACLGSVADLVDEVVVVDTGSTDGTKAVAARYGARVFEFPWCDSFATARNESLRHATGDWAFWMDADDRLDEDNRAKLRALFAGLGDANAAYAMKCLCLPDAATGSSVVVDHIRLFRNRPDVRWTYRIHEQILPGIRSSGGEMRRADVVIHHSGYRDPALRRRKLERDLRLLRMEDAERPDDPFTLFNFGQVAQELGQFAEAIPLLRRCLEKSHPKDSIVRKAYALLANSLRQVDQSAEALAACREGRGHYPDDTELLFVESILARERGDPAGAEACLRRLLTAPAETYFGSVDAGLRGYKTRQNLGVLCQEQGRPDEAAALFREALAEAPDFLPAWHGLAEVLLSQRRWDDLEAAAARLAALPGGAVDAALMRARGLLARQEFAAARTLLEGLIADAPRLLPPRILLTHALVQGGAEFEAAERALLAVLEIAPENVEARGTLDRLRRERTAERAAVDAVFAGNVGIADLYFTACRGDQPLRECLPALVTLARGCRHVTDVGTGTGKAATAFLYAEPDRLLCVDRVKYPAVDRLQACAGRTDFTFRQTDVLWEELEETDLLFLDSWHTYDQLAAELRLHAAKVRKYLVIHGTTTFADQGQDPGHRGIWPAVAEFLGQGTFRLKERRTDGSGLTVLERVAVANAAGITAP